MIRPACVPEHYLEADGCADAGGTLAATSRFGTRPTFSRLTSRRAFPSMIETSAFGLQSTLAPQRDPWARRVARKMPAFAGKIAGFDSSAGSEHNCSYVNPVEVRSAREGPGLHGWRQNISLLPAELFPHWEKASQPPRSVASSKAAVSKSHFKNAIRT